MSRVAMSSVHNQLIRDSAWRHERVSVAAYYIWQQRGLNAGLDISDWELAEAQIDALDER